MRALWLLLAQIVLVGGWLALSGRLVPVVVNDTPTYVEFPWDSVAAALDHIRTPGYPALLRLTRLVWEDHRGVPLVHYVIYSACVVLFFLGAERYFQSATAACAAASTLLYARILYGYVMTIATDTLGAAAGIAACGLTLWWLARPSGAIAAALSLTSALAWLIRPANLFVAALVPLLTWLLGRPEQSSPRDRCRTIGLALLLTCAPLLAYSLLRLAVVGRFSVVSFGGYNQIGVVGQFLEPGDVDALSADLQPLASAALRRRRQGAPAAPPADDLPRLNYTRMETHYDQTIWGEFVPAARELWGDDPGRINSQLRRLAAELIVRHPLDYAVWLAKATRQGAKKVLWDFADNPFTLALLLLALLKVCRPAFVRAGASGGIPGETANGRGWLGLALAYLVLALAVVIPVCPPLGRMTDAAAVLLAAPLAVWLWPRGAMSPQPQPECQ